MVEEVCNGWFIAQVALLTRLVATELVEQMLAHTDPGDALTVGLELRGPHLLVCVHTPRAVPAPPLVPPTDVVDIPAIMTRLTTAWGQAPRPDGGYTRWARSPSINPPAARTGPNRNLDVPWWRRVGDIEAV